MRIQTPEQNYLNEVFPLNDSDLQRIKDGLRTSDLDFMSVSGPEARILQFLIRALNLKKVVEIGTLHGYSAVAMAKAGAQVITLEKSPEFAVVSEKNIRESGLSQSVRVLCGDAEENLKSVEKDGPFDLVFIDANKGAYVSYLNWAEKHVRTGGLIIGDNTFLFGGVWGQSRDPSIGTKVIETMREFNRRLADPEKYNSILIPTFEGMTVAQKR